MKRPRALTEAERKVLGRLSDTSVQLLTGPDERLARGLQKRGFTCVVGERVVGGGRTYLRTQEGSRALLQDTLHKAAK